MRIYEERRSNPHNKRQVRLQFPILNTVPMNQKTPVAMVIQFLASGSCNLSHLYSSISEIEQELITSSYYFARDKAGLLIFVNDLSDARLFKQV